MELKMGRGRGAEEKFYEKGDRMRFLSRRRFVRLSGAAVAVAAGGLRYACAQAVDPGSGLVQAGRRHNERDGVAVDYRKAAELFQKAADAGSLDGQAWLGSMHLRGHGAAQDEAKVSELTSASAEADSPVGLRVVHTRLGVL